MVLERMHGAREGGGTQEGHGSFDRDRSSEHVVVLRRECKVREREKREREREREREKVMKASYLHEEGDPYNARE